MSKDGSFWRCGHPRTPENTVGQAKGQCRECHRVRARHSGRDAYLSLTPEEKFVRYRRYYLPRQIEATEHKLAMLRREAERLGLPL